MSEEKGLKDMYLQIVQLEQEIRLIRVRVENLLRNTGVAVQDRRLPVLELPLDDPSAFIGTKPNSITFRDGRTVATKNWRMVAVTILQEVDRLKHDRLLYLSGKIMGRDRTFLSRNPDQMDSPMLISKDGNEALYIEGHFGTEYLLRMTKHTAAAAGYDLKNIVSVKCHIPSQKDIASKQPHSPRKSENHISI